MKEALAQTGLVLRPENSFVLVGKGTPEQDVWDMWNEVVDRANAPSIVAGGAVGVVVAGTPVGGSDFVRSQLMKAAEDTRRLVLLCMELESHIAWPLLRLAVSTRFRHFHRTMG